MEPSRRFQDMGERRLGFETGLGITATFRSSEVTRDPQRSPIPMHGEIQICVRVAPCTTTEQSCRPAQYQGVGCQRQDDVIVYLTEGVTDPVAYRHMIGTDN